MRDLGGNSGALQLQPDLFDNTSIKVIVAAKNRTAAERADHLPADQSDLAKALRGDCPVFSPPTPFD